MQHLGHNYTKKLLVVYLKFKSNSHEFFCVLCVYFPYARVKFVCLFSPMMLHKHELLLEQSRLNLSLVGLVLPSASDFLQGFSFSLFFMIQELRCTRTIWWEFVTCFELGELRA